MSRKSESLPFRICGSFMRVEFLTAQCLMNYCYVMLQSQSYNAAECNRIQYERSIIKTFLCPDPGETLDGSSILPLSQLEKGWPSSRSP